MKRMTKLTDLQQKLSEVIDNIIENFEWEKVRRAMLINEWTWATINGETPTINQLKEVAISLLEEVAVQGMTKGKDYTISTGGFEAVLKFYDDEYDERIANLELKFVIDSWESEI